MTKADFRNEIIAITREEEYSNFVQKYFFSGTPYVFSSRDAEYYDFRKRIAQNFEIRYTDINIVGSSRFGFSPYKFTDFTYDSDIDVAICNEDLFENYFKLICDYNYKIRNGDIQLRQEQRKKYYYSFLKYFTSGWMRPDLLPQNTDRFKEIRENWDNFFKEISYGKSEVGNYEVKAGLFKNQLYAEKYYEYSLSKIKQKITN